MQSPGRRDERPKRGMHRGTSCPVLRIPSVESAKRGVDAFDGTSLPPAAQLCQSKRKTLPGEGRGKNPPSFNLSQYLRVLNKRYSFVYFWKPQVLIVVACKEGACCCSAAIFGTILR